MRDGQNSVVPQPGPSRETHQLVQPRPILPVHLAGRHEPASRAVYLSFWPFGVYGTSSFAQYVKERVRSRMTHS